MLARILAFIRRLQTWADALLFEVLSRVRLPGLKDMPLYSILVMLWRSINNRAFVLNSAAMAYSFFLAIFPTLIFFFSLLPFMPVANLDAEIMELLRNSLPSQAFELLENTFLGVLNQRNVGRLSLSLLVVLFLGIRGVMAMANAFNSMDPLHRKDRNFFQHTWVGLYIFLVSLVLATVAITVFVVGEQWMARYAKDYTLLGNVQYLGALLVSRLAILVTLLMALNFIYRTAPTYSYKWRYLSPGSVVAALLLLLAMLGLNYYLQNFTNYNKVYGSLGAAIMLLVWFYWISFVLQLGFHLNSNIERLVLEQNRIREQRLLLKRATDAQDGMQQDNTQWQAGRRL
ncbi:MAG: YihY/virulence factor BrkB family protein [Bacteroidetes bacterium]|nr:YihY/virulence factor BrkB family protein [Bacteroidota bacterium]